jgi:CRISPR-associated protein (TIGR02710 family)
MKSVPQELKKLGATEADWPSLVDCTGGTKIMSSAMLWASSRFPCEIIYVGTAPNAAAPRDGRTKGGVGVVKTGTEYIVQRKNPWNSVGYLEARSALEAFNRGQYGVAATALRELSEKITDGDARKLFRVLAGVCGGFYFWDIFEHVNARHALLKWVKELRAIAGNPQFLIPGLERFAEEAWAQAQLLEDIHSKEKMPWFVAKDLLANAWRRGELEEKYEDAVARCYSAIEKLAQFELRCKHGIDAGAARPEQIPDGIRDDFLRQYGGAGGKKLQFGLMAAMKLLLHLEEAKKTKSVGVGHRFFQDAKVEMQLRARNRSVLAHGVAPMKAKHYTELFKSALNRTDSLVS